MRGKPTRRAVTPDDVRHWPHILTQTLYTRGEIERFLAKVDVRGPDECWPWLACLTGTKGDRAVMIREGNGPKVYASRISYELATGEPLGDLLACHKCDDGACANPRCIFPGTPKDNTDDMHQKGRACKEWFGVGGERHPQAILTDAMVSDARRRAAAGESVSGLAREMGVTYSPMRNAIQGRKWKHVQTPPVPARSKRRPIHAVAA